MASSQMSEVVQYLRRAVLLHQGTGLTDGQLLSRFIEGRDEDAFAALIKRHAPMVWRVCRRALANHHDAEDAFQATFLVLVRKAATVLPREMVANWLYGVACTTARRGQAAAAKRGRREKQVAEMPEPPLVEPDFWADVRPVLDQQLNHLPDRYRAVIVLCDLECKTRKEVARQLGLPEGTVASRLSRGRALLAKRLARHGVSASGGALAIFARNLASAGVPAAVVSSTIKGARMFAAGQASAAGVISAKAAALTAGVLQAMLFSKVKTAIAVLLVLGILGILTLGAGGVISRTLATEAAGGTPAVQQQSKPDADNPHERLTELKQQLDQMQRKIARLEEEAQARRSGPETCDMTLVAKRFKYRVPFEIGRTQTQEGGRIEIREIWGTRPRIELGGQYLVCGKYVLPPGERGRLHFYASAGGAWGQTAPLDLQSTLVDKREGEFALVHGMAGPGYFHLILTASERYSRWFADVYFGTGDNVWREK